MGLRGHDTEGDAKRALSRLRGRGLGEGLSSFMDGTDVYGATPDQFACRTRSDDIEARDLTVLRFWNHDVTENLEGVTDAIRAVLKKKTLTQPSPAKAGEG